MLNTEQSLRSSRQLRAQIARAIERATLAGTPVLLSVSTSAREADPVARFAAARRRGEDAVLWRLPAEEVALVGIGTLRAFTAAGPDRFAEVSRAWRELTEQAVIVGEGFIDDDLASSNRRRSDPEPIPGPDPVPGANSVESPGPVTEPGPGQRAVPIPGPCTGPAPGPLLLGGFAFDAGGASGAWAGFGDAWMSLPRVLFGSLRGRAWITVNTLVTPDTDPAELESDIDALLLAAKVPAAEEVIAEGVAALPWAAGKETAVAEATAHGSEANGVVPPAPVPGGEMGAAGVAPESAPPPHDAPLRVEDLHPVDHWLTAVERVATAIRSGTLEKAVLARSVRVVSPGGFDPEPALRYLQGHYPKCHIFAVARGGACFLGATPERIVRREGERIQVACLAGSTARGRTPHEDQQLTESLLRDAKNIREHQVVLHSILEALEPVALDIEVAPRAGLRKLANVQHLYTPVSARVAADVDILDLVDRIHPTPAIGGHPTRTALALIRAEEELERGWYAGPIGWLDRHGQGEFAVGLRSALLRDDEARLFAGCGIMGDSDPRSEYDESVLKLRPMLAALEGARR